MTKQILGSIALALTCLTAHHAVAKAPDTSKEYLVKLAPGAVNHFSTFSSLARTAGKAEILVGDWVKITDTQGNLNVHTLTTNNPAVVYVQPNYRIKLLENYQTQDQAVLKAILSHLSQAPQTTHIADNPAIPAAPEQNQGEDPLFNKQWGMIDNHVKEAWELANTKLLEAKPMVVAVLDTGVDYTHEDLLPNMWRNPGETGLDAEGRNKETNGIDDDQNGYIDDVVGWDFVSNDNKPYDLAVAPLELLKGGGNPGHGTHCAGNVAAAANNGKGIVGVAPNAKIMALRFISEKGVGTTSDVLKAIKYAVDNGALITSNSWGSEGEDPADQESNQALREMIQYAESKGTLFIAAAGNGHQGVGYNNDSDPNPAYPASYPYESIISVAAINSNGQLGSFSNWGKNSVDVAAPGVKVFSTTVEGKYSDTVIDFLGIVAHWDGTSMAAPHVAGAAALYWAHHPEKSWQEVKAAILQSVTQTPALQNKTSAGGKLNVLGLMQQP